MKERLITTAELAALESEGTNAHRLWTSRDGWVERFGADFLISAKDDGLSVARALPQWLEALGLEAARIFARRLVKQPREDHKPEQLAGAELPLQTVVSERV